MDLESKFKTSLDEARMLVLGCQVLIGFQLNAVFQSRFEDLSTRMRVVNAIALLMMVMAFALLVAPSCYHGLATRHRATLKLTAVITAMICAALVPLALALGLDILIAIDRIFGFRAGAMASVGFSSLALAFWWGLETVARRAHGQEQRRMANQARETDIALSKRIDHMLTEARTILPGAQALLGFQLVAVLTNGFDRLPLAMKSLHAVALGFVAFAVILLMTPAAYHRIVYAGEESEHFLAIGSLLVIGATLPLALGIAADVVVTIATAFGSAVIGLAAGGVSLSLFVGLWYIYPITARFGTAAAKNQRKGQG